MIDTVVKYLQENNVRCKKVEDDREDYGDFIAIFGYGDLTREDIVKQIADNNLSCIFFECSIREDEYNGGRKKNGGIVWEINQQKSSNNRDT